ncbi:hypothetical protein GCM10011505_23440 [Tistrella bauzanensis]|uniref:2TM domain-containing protein n=1 Tax=Tistrella bauzanensis TaxID=657419 RepID=A0ABQ1IJP8_9PROT|nr:hypothetical protein [Tistrella bauzanensis]GGB41284.1 hypothetical protein GCM10011505_23440 [Tistrella bauzanensis]
MTPDDPEAGVATSGAETGEAAQARRARRLTGFYLHGFAFAAGNGLIALLTALLKVDDPEGRIGFALALWAGLVVLHGLWAYGILARLGGARDGGSGPRPPHPPSSAS